VSFKDLGASIVDDDLGGEKIIDGVVVRAFPLNHPGGCQAYCFEKEGKKVVYATDNELEIGAWDVFPDPGNTGPLRRCPEALVEAMEGADLLILDAQYDDREYATKRKWGHSSCFSATDLAIKAGAKSLALFHHDPESTDRDIDEKVQSCRQRAEAHGANLTIMAAREGVELKL
jgi:ribonuclease BN (tRNA processing enzyme)